MNYGTWTRIYEVFMALGTRTMSQMLAIDDCKNYVHSLELKNIQEMNDDECVNFILLTERQDFEENRAINHIYFKAYTAIHGLMNAKQMLLGLINGE